jgi:hypothetical protein
VKEEVMEMAEQQDRKDERSPESHWRVDDPEGQPCHTEIISCARAVQEALATLGCDASDQQVRDRLREQGMEVETGAIARVREELKRSKDVCRE